MPGTGGLELQKRLDRLGVRLPTIVMTRQSDVQTAVRAMKAGAVDFLEKPFDEARLLAAVDAALAGNGRASLISAALAAAQRLAALTRREREVLNALVEGRPNKVIAHDLGISVRTVEVHRARMLDRLGAGRPAEAIRLAVMAGLVPTDPSAPPRDEPGEGASESPESPRTIGDHQ
jgi:two-component system response regulator FixJ